ncbi:MAG: hypothetical protein ACK4TG_11075, partial [Thermaurantiacus sp.]
PPPPPPAAPAAKLDLYRQADFGGASLSLDGEVQRMHFAARSVQAKGKWTLCPRPFFGGDCIEVDGEEARLRLPRAFSGAVRSAKPVQPAEEPAMQRPKPTAEAKTPRY